MNDRRIKDILADRGLAPSKKLGQNFLVHRQTAEKIVRLAGLGPEDTVVELGVGLGALTLPLAAAVGRVVGIELDAGLIRFHREEGILPTNVKLVHQDLLQADFAGLAAETGGPLKIMANLPYSVSNPLLFKLIESRKAIGWAVLMLQKEVADRLIALPGTKEYGILTVLLAACATVTPLLHLGPEQFHPRPQVDSVVVRLGFEPPPERARRLPPYDGRLLRRVVKGAFQQRRKTMLNSLAGAWPELGKERWGRVLAAADVPPAERAERLALEDFVRLTRALAGEIGPL
ncbi:MAG: 16S rRNA (adenine(1518)-N(6)/adenine(1519)-N(6))-dimethyltransferase RsmA [Desulfobacteraceae bacterium]|nr:16S rRNA (adenine(1518)-N(6)/adenine(1519)-N(6))-dimethyltransferase RsmA [Desulfobacteraceae bacterium]